MSNHLIETIFINLPITTAFERLWQLLLSAEGLEAFNHYFNTNKILNLKSHSFSREISLRVPLPTNSKLNSDQQEPAIRVNQEVQKDDKERKITYRNLTLKESAETVSGAFFHQFQQNNKGQTYLIFGSSAKNGAQAFPEKSEAQIELIKIKDLLENDFQKHLPAKGSLLGKCC